MTETDPRAARRAIIHKHCVMQTGARAGTPRFCYPKRDEAQAAEANGRPAQRRAPIIFGSLEAAQACAEELAQLDGMRMNTYVCPRSTHGHAHLSDR